MFFELNDIFLRKQKFHQTINWQKIVHINFFGIVFLVVSSILHKN